jgi:hypothetical protein
MDYFVIVALHWPKMVVHWKLFKTELEAEQFAIQEMGLKAFEFQIRKIST